MVIICLGRIVHHATQFPFWLEWPAKGGPDIVRSAMLPSSEAPLSPEHFTATGRPLVAAATAEFRERCCNLARRRLSERRACEFSPAGPAPDRAARAFGPIVR